MIISKWLWCLAIAALIGVLLFSGCSSERSTEQGEQKPQPKQDTVNKPEHQEIGKASWYGPGFQGHETASGETFDSQKMTAAHPSLPMGVTAEVTNLDNGKKVEVKINDRGPYAKDRAIDLSSSAAKKLGIKKKGAAKVKIVTKSAKKKRKHSIRAKKVKRTVPSSNGRKVGMKGSK